MSKKTPCLRASVFLNTLRYLFPSNLLLRYRTGYHTDRNPTVMTVMNITTMSVACTLTG